MASCPGTTQDDLVARGSEADERGGEKAVEMAGRRRVEAAGSA